MVWRVFWNSERDPVRAAKRRSSISSSLREQRTAEGMLDRDSKVDRGKIEKELWDLKRQGCLIGRSKESDGMIPLDITPIFSISAE